MSPWPLPSGAWRHAVDRWLWPLIRGLLCGSTPVWRMRSIFLVLSFLLACMLALFPRVCLNPSVASL